MSSSCDSDSAEVSTFSFSDLGNGDITLASKKQKLAAKKWKAKEVKKQKKRDKKRQQNKISKDDFHAKNMEFKIWLSEEKSLKPENISPGKQKQYFKKFVKKWNNKKLLQKYYRGIDLWVEGTPTAQTDWAMPGSVEVTPGSLPEDYVDNVFGRGQDFQFGTFGRRKGAEAAKQLRVMRNDFRRFSKPTEHLYDEPLSPKDRRCLRKSRSQSYIPVYSALETNIPAPSDSRQCSPNEGKPVTRSDTRKRSFSTPDMKSSTYAQICTPEEVTFKVQQTCCEKTPSGHVYTRVAAVDTVGVGALDKINHLAYLEFMPSTPTSDKPVQKQKSTSKVNRRRSLGPRVSKRHSMIEDPVYSNVPVTREWLNASLQDVQNTKVENYVEFEPTKRILPKQDSYVAKLEKASQAVFETLSHNKSTRASLRSTSTPMCLQGNKGRAPTPFALPPKPMEVYPININVTPGKSAKPTKL